MHWSMRLTLFLLAIVSASLNEAGADDAVGDFYRGKNVTLVVGAGPAGAYDIHGRLLGRHLGKHIPGNPRMIVQNMTGASSVLAANYVFNVAPQDGTVLANVLNTLPIVQVLGEVKTQFDVAALQWIGNMTEEVYVVVVSDAAPVSTIQQAMQTETLMGATTAGALSWMYPRLINLGLKTKFRIVAGYKDGTDIDLAMQRGEVHGRAGETWYGSKGVYGELYQRGKIKVLALIGFNKAADLPQVPLLLDLADDPEIRRLFELFSSPSAIGKPTVAGPKVPPERVAALRKAYDETMADPEFLVDADKLGINIKPVRGPALTELVARLTKQSSESLLTRAREAMGSP